MATTTEYTRGWVAVQAMTQNGTGIGSDTGDKYGNLEADIYWSRQRNGGVSMTQFFGYERTSVANITTSGVTTPAAQATAWKSKVALITANDKPVISQNPSNSQVPGDLIYGAFNNTLSDNGAFAGNTALNAGPTLSAQQTANLVAQDTYWTFNIKNGDQLPVSGVVGPWARSEQMWDNGNFGSNSIGVNAV